MAIDVGNGPEAHVAPSGKTDEEYARLAADAALQTQYAVGGLLRELSDHKRDFALFRTNMGEFKNSVEKSFHDLGVKMKRGDRVIEHKVSELAEEIEDTKTHNLRVMARKYRWWKKAALAGAGTTIVAVVAGLILRYVFHV